MTYRRLIAGFLGILAVLGPAFGQQVEMHPELQAAETVYRQDGPAQALPLYEALLEKFQQEGDSENVAITEGYLGAVNWRLGNFESARMHLDTALTLKRQAGLRLEVGKSLNVLGLLEWDLGNFQAAIGHFSEASDIGREAGDSKLEGATLNNLSLVYDELGDYDTSLAQYQRVLSIYESADFPRGMNDTLGNIGGVHLLLGHFSQAADYYRRALEISEELKSAPAMSQDHGNLGLCYTGMGRVDLAIEQFDEALRLAEQTGMRQEQGLWLRGMANAHILAGRLDLGLQYHRSALEIYEKSGARTLLIESLHDMGQLYLELGDPISAEDYFRRAMDLSVETGLSQAVTLNQLALGDIQRRHGNYEASVALYVQALSRAKAAGEEGLQATALLRLAAIHLEWERTDDAATVIDEAFTIARRIQARREQAEALYMQAEVARLAEEPQAALEKYRQAEGLSNGLLDPDLAWQIEYGRGLVLAGLGNKEAAVKALLAAVAHIESVRNRLEEKRFQAGYIQDKHQVYIDLARLQLDIGKTFEALNTAERLRNWSFDRQSAESERVRPTRVEDLEAVELRERIRQLQRNLQSETSRPPPEQRQLAIETFSRELMLAEQQYQGLLDDANSRSRHGRQDSQLHRSELQDALQPGEALVEFLVGAENILVFVITDEISEGLRIAANRRNLHTRLELLRDLVAQHDNNLWESPASSLANTLILPVLQRGWLDNVSHIYLVPHDVLNYLPFALLPTSPSGAGHTVIDHYTLAYLPTASALTKPNEHADQSGNFLAMAPSRSRLSHAQEEASTIARLFYPNADAVLGEAATESWFKDNAARYRILHLATHGYFNKLNPLFSGLQLESDQDNDGLLEVHEILDLSLNSDLVTLSACETGLGSGYFAEFPAGDDFVGMTRAFLQVGSVAVLATLWEVDDRSTVDLMRGFYQNMEASDQPKNEALALTLAQKELKSTQAYQHPYYWAPFVLMGTAHQAQSSRG